MVAQAVPFDNPDWNYKAYADFSDYLMLMAYDEHWETGARVQSLRKIGYEQILAKRMRDLDPNKIIVCIGSYGYDWSNKQKEATEVSFQEAVLAARDSEAKINFDSASRNPNFSYDEDDGSHHTVLVSGRGNGLQSNQNRAEIQAFRLRTLAVWVRKTRRCGTFSAGKIPPRRSSRT